MVLDCGNLIALPLQHEARKHRNTVFVDDTFEPYPDQWGQLASARRMDPAAVFAIAEEATRTGRVVGVRIRDPAEDGDAQPWMRTPSGRPRRPLISSPLPREARAVLSQRLFLEKAGLPSPLLDQVKRLAAFQNPGFYAKQRMRLSTAMTPRVIACAEELPQHIALPRGCRTALEELLNEYGVALAVEDQREAGEAVPFRFQGELTVLQYQAAQALLRHETGMLVAPPGVGKTVLGTLLVAERRRSTLVLVRRQPLLDQWIAQLSMFLGISEVENCPAVCERSCADCLQGFRNAFVHRHLDRHAAARVLGALGNVLELEHEIPPRLPAAAGPEGVPTNRAEAALKAMLARAELPPGEWHHPIDIGRPLGVTRPDVFFAGDDAHDPGICIYLDGLSDGIHGNPETAARDRAIRESLRAHRYEVIEIPASDLSDREAMRGHFFRLARLLVGLDRAREVRDQTGWFEE